MRHFFSPNPNRNTPPRVIVLYGRWPTRHTAEAVLTGREICERLAREAAERYGVRVAAERALTASSCC